MNDYNRKIAPIQASCMGVCDQSDHACASAQVDGAYEDWVEVLRLVYHGGGS